MLTESTLTVAGADTHTDTIHVAAISMTGAAIGDREFPTTRSGYAAAIRFLTLLGQLERIGVEGTASYGAGFTRALTAAGIEVVEVTRAVKSTRRLKGKSDPLDAYSAARTTLAGDGLATPKDDATSGLRALQIARRSAVKHRTAVINQIKAMLVSAPDTVREKYRGLTTLRLIEALARCRPDAQTDPWAQSVLNAAKMLAQRVQFLETQADALEAQIEALVTAANPGLRAAYGVGPDTAAQLLITAGANPHRLHSEAAFAALCGVAPVPASSGKTTRHRLSRGGDRAANNALFRIALVRMSCHQPTKNYVQRQLGLGPHPDGDPAQAQTSHRPRDLQTTDPPHRSARVRRPAPGTARKKHHRHRRCQPLRSLAHRHLPNRTRTTTRRYLRRALPALAQSNLTPIGASNLGCPIRAGA